MRRRQVGGNMTAIPKTMRAAAIDRFGGPDVIQVRMLPVPVPDADESTDRPAYRGGWRLGR